MNLEFTVIEPKQHEILDKFIAAAMEASWTASKPAQEPANVNADRSESLWI